MTWAQVIAGALIIGLVVGGCLAVVVWWMRHENIYWLMERYEDRVHRQSLAEARRLLDANRTHPVRLDSGPPVIQHKARVRRVPRSKKQ